MGLCQSILCCCDGDTQSVVEDEPFDSVVEVKTQVNHAFVNEEVETSLTSNTDDPEDKQVEVGTTDSKAASVKNVSQSSFDKAGKYHPDSNRNTEVNDVQTSQDFDDEISADDKGSLSLHSEPVNNVEEDEIVADKRKDSVDNGLPIPGADSEMNELYQMCLELHNEYRAKHTDTGPLKFSVECCKTAQAWADNGIYKHSPDDQRPGFGENIAFSNYSKRQAVEIAIRGMYDEIDDYSYEMPNHVLPGKKVGHFTQVQKFIKFNLSTYNLDNLEKNQANWPRCCQDQR